MLFRQRHYLPKQLFFRFVLTQILIGIPALIITAAALRIYIGQRTADVHNIDEVFRLFDQAFLFLAILSTIIFSGISLWVGYKLVLPLGRLIAKARAILKKDYSAFVNETEATVVSDAGEWSDLERTLNRIEFDMQTQDIRLSKEREEIEAIISAISEAVIAIDKEGNVLFYNSQFALLFGGKELQRARGRLADFFRNPDVLDIFRETLQDGMPRDVSTQIAPQNESLPRYFSLSVAPLRLQSGDTYGAVGVFHDVSELKRLDQVRIDFVANVSHELRTPLTSIKGYTETLRDDLKQNRTDLAIKYLDTISRNSDRLIALVQDLLNLSAIESGTALEKENFSLRELTDKVLLQLDLLRASKQHEIRVRYEAEFLYADPKRVEQVLYNLTENAIKYVPQGKKIELEWRAGGEGDVYLHVHDDGPGIPVEHHPRLFERFYRVDAARNRDQGGTGLGLAIVKHIMQRHGGVVKVQGGLGQGTEFICRFPQRKEA